MCINKNKIDLLEDNVPIDEVMEYAGVGITVNFLNCTKIKKFHFSEVY